MNPEHPMSRFTCGNKDTLNQTDVVDQLKKFYNDYYSSNLMKLVIISSKDSADIYQNTKPIFEKIPNKKIDRS